MKARLLRLAKHTFLMLAGSAIIGTLLLIFVFCLPVDGMRAHVFSDVDEMLLHEEDIPAEGFDNYLWTERETYTDTIMVQNSIEKIEGKNAYEHAIWVFHCDLDGEFWTPEASLEAIAHGADTEQMYLHQYARYWHGYLVYLKPLLLFLSWKQIMILEVVLHLLLMLLVMILALKKGRLEVGIAMLTGALFLKPILVLVSLTMSVCWIITLAAFAFMLLYHDKLKKRDWYMEFFLAIGIFTAYFDFLTYPVVTLGFPLCAYFIIEEGEAWKKNLQKLIGYSVCWGIGYAGMWAMKWVIADLTLQTGTIRDAVWSIIGRTEAVGGRPRFNGGFYVIGLNLQEYDREIYFIMAAAITLLSLAAIFVACRKVGMKGLLPKLLPFPIIFCIPFAWIIAVQHHSALHARFTFRIIAVAMLAVSSMGLRAWRETRALGADIR